MNRATQLNRKRGKIQISAQDNICCGKKVASPTILHNCFKDVN